MRLLSELRERLRALLFRRREERDLDEELRVHVEMQAEANVRRGMDPADAKRQAHVKLGGVEQTKETVRNARGVGVFEIVARDVRYGLRRLARERGFSVPVVLTLALGIGATTAVFSVVDATLLRPLPFEDDDRLVTVRRVNVPLRFPDVDEGPQQSAHVTDLDSLDHIFAQHATYAAGSMNLTGADEPRHVSVTLATPSFFSTLGVLPRLGRPFNVEEGTPEGARAAILGDGLWRTRFGADPDAVGRTITLNGIDYRVVGVMPRGFAFPGETDLWVPFPVPMTPEYWEPFQSYVPTNVLARLAPGATVPQAGERVLALVNAYRPPDRQLEATATEMVRPLRDVLVRQRRTAVLVLMGATALMLLIACANAANLMLARATRRRRELTLRSVLGASSRRLLHQLLVESVLLALVGGALGVAVAYASIGALTALVPSDLAGSLLPTVDERVLAFAVTVAVASGIAFGIWPALRAGAANAGEAIRSGHGAGATERESTRLRRVFVVAEIAFALVLLVGAGVMIRSFRAVLASDPGLHPQHVATAELSLADARYPDRATRRGFYERVLERVGAMPGVDAAAIVNELPLRGGGGVRLGVSAGDAPEDPDAERIHAQYLVVSPDYFRALGIPMLAGRSFEVAAASTGPREVVIGRELAHRLWPGENPIGRPFRIGWPGSDRPLRTVVGVVGDVRPYTLDAVEVIPQMYLPLGEHMAAHVTLVARGSAPARTLAAQLREAVRSVDPEQAVYNVRAMDDVIAHTLAPRRTTTMLVSVFGALALLLAAVGIYGVISFGVAQRRPELGIRIALGARPGNVVRLVVREGFALAVLGAVIGVAGAWALSRTLESLVFEVTARDPVAFAVAPAVLVVVATVAALVPAVRATRVNPLESIRTE